MNSLQEVSLNELQQIEGGSAAIVVGVLGTALFVAVVAAGAYAAGYHAGKTGTIEGEGGKVYTAPAA